MQKVGRCVRQFDQLGEAVLFITANYRDKMIPLVEAAERGARASASSVPVATEDDPGGGDAGEEQDVGVRVQVESTVLDTRPQKRARTMAKAQSEFEMQDSLAFARFITTTDCRRKIWDDYFENSKKGMRGDRID